VTHPESQNYDTLADEYARHRRAHAGVVAELVAKARLGPASRVLEVGCGTANHLGALHDAAGCACSGIDPSERMLAKARENAGHANLVLGRAERLTFDDASFDLVYSVDVIHHVVDQAAFYREARRVLAEGGFVCTVTESEEMIRRREPHATYFPETVDVELARYPRIDDLRRLMYGAGFRAIEVSAVAVASPIEDARMYSEKACSSLHLIPKDAFDRGIQRLEADLAGGPIPRVWERLLLWGAK
jgi:ubiquinone/menaquinone biosynthesis C-methylase UbiE